MKDKDDRFWIQKFVVTKEQHDYISSLAGKRIESKATVMRTLISNAMLDDDGECDLDNGDLHG